MNKRQAMKTITIALTDQEVYFLLDMVEHYQEGCVDELDVLEEKIKKAVAEAK